MGKEDVFIPSTHIFSEYFSSYSSGSFDLTLFFFWFKGWRERKSTGLFIYSLQKAFKACFQSWFLDFYTHSCMSGSWSDLLGGELHEGQKMCLTDTQDLRRPDPDLCLRAGAAASMWWKGLLGKSSSHPTLQFGLWPLLRFCHEKEMHAFILKYQNLIQFQFNRYLLSTYTHFVPHIGLRTTEVKNYSSWERK